VMKRLVPSLRARVEAPDEASRAWAADFISLGTKLQMAVPNGDARES
jgi:hypothetical protein